MSTWIAVLLFVIGAVALVASIAVERRPARRGASAPAEAEAAAKTAETEVAEAEETVAEVAPAEPPPSEVAPEPEPLAVIATPEAAPASPGHEATGAEDRLARLRAELTGAPEAQAAPAAPSGPAERADPGRVFAAVASVGRAPEADELLEAAEVPETAPAPPHETEAEEAPGAGHTHALPLVNHSDLVTHLRREHTDVESNGSTIQMRLLHEQAHASAG